MAPSRPKTRHRSLPPILRSQFQKSRSGYSKAPRGLSVLLRVTGIFTRIATSPSPPLRQCPSRYAIRAGRNLPDEEFSSVLLRPSSVKTPADPSFLRISVHRCTARTISSSARERGVRHVVSEGIRMTRIFPADRPHRSNCHAR